jgi:hypothetical protein
VIKYNEQEKYKEKISGKETSFSYSYLEDCASGKNAPYMQSAKNEAELKNALDKVAEDIKAFAGHEDAKNVN